MNRDDDFIAQLEDYLDNFEGVVPLSSSARSEIHARVSETRQVRGSGGPEIVVRVLSRMSTPARWGFGAAAVLAFVVLGAAALNLGGSGPTIGALPTPLASPVEPTASLPPASTEPTASAPSSTAAEGPARLPPEGTVSCGEGLPLECIQAGTYQLSNEVVWPATISFEVPEGWWPYVLSGDLEGVLVENGMAPEGSGWGVMFMTVGDVSRDPCDVGAGQWDRDDTASVDGLIAAMQSWPGFEVSDPTPIEVDGYAGQSLEITSTETVSTCPSQRIWSTTNSATVDAYPMVGVAGQPRPGQFRILDVEGELVVIRTTNFSDLSPHELQQGLQPDPERHVTDQAELAAILDSIRITP